MNELNFKFNTAKACAYIRGKLEKYIQKKEALEKTKENIKAEAGEQKEKLYDCRRKNEQKLYAIKNKRKIPGISENVMIKLDEMYGEIIEYINKADVKINELYDKLDEQIEQIDEQIYEFDMKIDEINDLADDETGDGYETEFDYAAEIADEELLRELEEEIRRIEQMQNAECKMQN